MGENIFSNFFPRHLCPMAAHKHPIMPCDQCKSPVKASSGKECNGIYNDIWGGDMSLGGIFARNSMELSVGVTEARMMEFSKI